MGTLEIVISKDGSKVTVDGHGFSGGTCKTFGEAILSKLGETVDEKKKPEYYQNNAGTVKIGG